MLIAAVYDKFRLYSTDTFSVRMNWRDDTGQLINLTGWHGRLRLLGSVVDRTVIHEIDDTNGVILGDGTTEPNIDATIPDEDVVSLAVWPGYLTFEVETPDGEWQRLIEGKVKSMP